MKNLEKYIIPALCLFNIILHLMSIRFLEYHRDELLYFSLSNHLDLGYASVPPLISWLAFIMKGALGFSMFSVKLLPALLSGLFVYLASLITKELGGDRFAQILTAVALTCTPFVLRAFILFQPVCFDVFFWTLIYYLVLKFINSNQNKWLYYLGGIIGVAILNKHLVLLQVMSLIAVLPFTKYRSLFQARSFYICLGLAILVASPNLIWQMTNDFPLFSHMAALNENQLQNVEKSAFMLDQVFMFYSSFILAVIGFVFLFYYRKSSQLWLFSLSALFVLVALLLLRGKSYYSAGIYPILICSGSVFIGSLLKELWSRILLIALITLLIVPLVPVGIPILPSKKLVTYFDRLEDFGIDIGRIHENGKKYPLPQDFADMTGWNDIAAHAKKAFDMVEDKSSCAIYGENYGIAGAVTLINHKHGLPEALSFSDSYRYWAPRRFEPDLTSLIYINDELGANVEALFEEILVVGQIDDPLSRQYGVTIYLCKKPRRSFNEFWAEVLDAVFEK